MPNHLGKMRAKQGGMATTPKPQPAANPSPAEPFLVEHRCGHKVPLKELQGDNFRDRRIAKAQARDCAPCRAAKLEREQQAAKERRAAKNTKTRFVTGPETAVGCRFTFDHVGIRDWTATLSDMSTGEVVATCTAKNLRGAIEQLTAAWLAKHPPATTSAD